MTHVHLEKLLPSSGRSSSDSSDGIGADMSSSNSNPSIHDKGACAPRWMHWTHVHLKDISDKNFFVVSISTASLFEVVFHHFRV